MYTINGRFEWDSGKARQNLVKHGVSFDDVGSAYDDSEALFLFDEKHSTVMESRELLIGHTDKGVILMVVFTRRQSNIRIISARQASRRERRIYYEAQRENRF